MALPLVVPAHIPRLLWPLSRQLAWLLTQLSILCTPQSTGSLPLMEITFILLSPLLFNRRYTTNDDQ